MINKVFNVAKNMYNKQMVQKKLRQEEERNSSLPVNNKKVIFDNFGGKGFGCNPKYIAQELIRQDAGLDLVWMVNDENAYVPSPIRKVKYGTAEARTEMATAKVVVTNRRMVIKNKKADQYLIQTWHSSFGIKCVEQEAEALLPEDYVKMAKKSSEQTDVFVSGGSLATERYKNHFWYEGEIMECGCPRNDILFVDSPETVKKIKENLGINDDSRLVLYAPTFRAGSSLEIYNFDCRQMLETLNNRGGRWKILVRLHPNASKLAGIDKLFTYDEDIIDATAYPDFQELMLASDVLITDYSSSIFDFALMGREIFMYTPDLEEYKKERGVRKMFFEIPYEMCLDNAQLNMVAAQSTPQDAKERADKLSAMLCSADKGNASAAVAQRIRAVTGI